MAKVAPPNPANWFKSSASGTGNCVEVAHSGDGVWVRDSKNPTGPRLAFTQAEWTAFLIGVRQGEFDNRPAPA